MKLEICRQIFEKHPEISSITKIRSVGAELFHVDRRTDMMKLTVAFRDTANAPENAESCDRQPTIPVTSVFSPYRYWNKPEPFSNSSTRPFRFSKNLVLYYEHQPDAGYCFVRTKLSALRRRCSSLTNCISTWPSATGNGHFVNLRPYGPTSLKNCDVCEINICVS
jgi:hypothetical protein